MSTKRKGDVVAVETNHSYTGRIGAFDARSGRYKTWSLAYVEGTSADHMVVKRIRWAGTNTTQPASIAGRVWTISGENQAAAKRLADSLTAPRDWPTGEAIKAAIVSASI